MLTLREGDRVARLCLQLPETCRGLARRMMTTALDDIREAGYAAAGLDTVTFMTEAIALYRACGFDPCEPLHDIIPELAPITLFFRRVV